MTDLDRPDYSVYNAWMDDQIQEHGDLGVPCSRWGRYTSECGPVAFDLALIYVDANGGEIDNDLLESMMSLVVNDHDDVANLIRDHGSRRMLHQYADKLDNELPEWFVLELLRKIFPDAKTVSNEDSPEILVELGLMYTGYSGENLLGNINVEADGWRQ